MWIVYMEESGEEHEFKTKKEALAFIRGVKRFDKENGLEGEVFHLYRE